MDKSLILGSSSAIRRQILTDAGYQFRVMIADIDEKALGDRSNGCDPRQLVKIISNAKADAILRTTHSSELENCYLITTDTVVTKDDQVLEKPLDDSEARCFLRSYSKSLCSVVGNITLTNPETNQRVDGVDETFVHFDEISEGTIDALIAEGKVMTSSGALMIENPILKPCIRRVEGREDSIMGLNVEILENLRRQLDVTTPS